MIISLAAQLFDCKSISSSKATVRHMAFALDCIAAIALLVISTLAITGMLSLSPAASWALFGAGIVYSATMLLTICHRSQVNI